MTTTTGAAGDVAKLPGVCATRGCTRPARLAYVTSGPGATINGLAVTFDFRAATGISPSRVCKHCGLRAVTAMLELMVSDDDDEPLNLGEPAADALATYRRNVAKP